MVTSITPTAPVQGTSDSLYTLEPPADEYFDPYAGCADEAAIESIDFETPDPGNLLMHNLQPWVAGDEVFVDLVVSRCARVSSFRYGDVELWGTTSGVEGHSYIVTVVSHSASPDSSRIRLRLFHENLGEGLRKAVTVSVEQPKNGRTSTALFHVNWVAEVNGDTEITILEEDVHNALLAGLYESFGDEGRSAVDDGEYFFIHDPALEPCTPLDAFDRGCLRVEIVEDVGVRFSLELRLDLAYVCDPVVQVRGAVAHQPDGNGGFEAVWVEDLDVQVDVPGLCALLSGVVPSIVGQEIAEALVDDLVKERIEPLLTQNANCGAGCGFAGIPEYFEGEIAVPVRPFLSHVTIEVPYVAQNGDRDVWGRNLFVATGQDVMLIPSGSALLCHGQQQLFYQGCEAYGVSVVGLENFRSPTPTVPDPWELRGRTWFYYPFRQELRDAMYLPDRAPSTLIARNSPVGMLLAKSAGEPARRLVTPCRIPASDAPSSLGFSPNDRWDRGLGAGARRVTMVFLDLPDVENIAQCPVATDSVAQMSATSTGGIDQTGTFR